MKLLVATTNPGKIIEYRDLLDRLPVEIIGLHGSGIDFDVAETGATFEENALLKAQAYAQACGCMALADDSGLCVDALDGAPGIYSARYAHSDPARIERLLSAMQHIPKSQRGAKFMCVIALVLPHGEAHTFEGECLGQIAYRPSGDNGFGFDPVFFMPEQGHTMASLPTSLKNRVSHRARAAAKAKDWLMQYLASQ